MSQNIVSFLWQKKTQLKSFYNEGNYIDDGSNGTRTHNHLVRKWPLNHLAKQAKWLNYVVSTYLYGAFDRMLLSCHVRVNLHSHLASLAKWLSVRLRTSGCGFEFCCCRLNFRYGACEEFLDIQATIECRFTLKLVRDNIITYSTMAGSHRILVLIAKEKTFQRSMLFWANIQSVKLQRRKERGKLFFIKWIILVFLGGFLGGILYML